jgi:putative phage-type endonuclease
VPVTSLVFDNAHTHAEFIGNHANGSAEWHELRKQGIGGSEIGTICGLNKWESAYTLWAKKSGLIPDQVEQSEAMEAGTLLEKFILTEYFERLNPDLTIWGDVGTWKLDWSHANPDAIYQTADGSFGVWECKTARFEDDWVLPKRGERGTGEHIPRSYYAQVQWYLRVMGFGEAIVSVLFGGQKYREYLVVADKFAQETDLELATLFWIGLNNGEAPAWDGSTSTYETVRAENPDIVDDVVDIPNQLGNDYLIALNNSKQVEETLNTLKSHILSLMGSVKAGRINGEVRVVRQAGRNGGSPFLVNKEVK